MKAKPRYKPLELRRFHKWVATDAHDGCLVCHSPATIQHVTGYADRPGRISRSHWLVVPLCPRHHLIQHGPRESVEALGHQGFFQTHGYDLYREAMRLADEWRRMAA